MRCGSNVFIGQFGRLAGRKEKEKYCRLANTTRSYDSSSATDVRTSPFSATERRWWRRIEMQLVASPTRDREDSSFLSPGTAKPFAPSRARHSLTHCSLLTGPNQPTHRRHFTNAAIYNAAASCPESVQNPLLSRPRCRPHPSIRFRQITKEHELGDRVGCSDAEKEIRLVEYCSERWPYLTSPIF
jgi:hypothetical protein